MKLLGLNLKVEHITRQSIFEASYVCACDNCGKAIVNIATVSDENGKRYEIGLDCKKTLIDKPVIDSILKSDSYDAKYKAKEYKQQANHVEQFLKFAAYPDVDIEINNSEVTITDRKPHKQFAGFTGNNIYMENTQYLVKLGLGDFLQKLQRKIRQTA